MSQMPTAKRTAHACSARLQRCHLTVTDAIMVGGTAPESARSATESFSSSLLPSFASKRSRWASSSAAPPTYNQGTIQAAHHLGTVFARAVHDQWICFPRRWNVLDAIIVLASLLEELFLIHSLRIVRVLRALRLVSRNPGMRLVVRSLIEVCAP